MGISGILYRAFSLPPLSGQGTSKELAKQPLQRATSEPNNPHQQADRKAFFGANTASNMKRKLNNLFSKDNRDRRNSTGSRKEMNFHASGNLVAAAQTAQHSEFMLHNARHKLSRDKESIGNELAKWAESKDGDVKLAFQLKKFIQPGTNKDKIAGYGPDGLRSAVTGLEAMMRSDASPALKARAESLKDAVVFKAISYEGHERQVTPFNINQFGTQDSLKRLDSLNIPPSERQAIATRFMAALEEMDALNQAYAKKETEAPAPKFDPLAVIPVDGDIFDDKKAAGTQAPTDASTGLHKSEAMMHHALPGAQGGPLLDMPSGPWLADAGQPSPVVRRNRLPPPTNTNLQSYGVEQRPFSEQLKKTLNLIDELNQAKGSYAKANILAKLTEFSRTDAELKTFLDQTKVTLIKDLQEELDTETDPVLQEKLLAEIDAIRNPVVRIPTGELGQWIPKE